MFGVVFVVNFCNLMTQKKIVGESNKGLFEIKKKITIS
jgi:hypothetical protein